MTATVAFNIASSYSNKIEVPEAIHLKTLCETFSIASRGQNSRLAVHSRFQLSQGLNLETAIPRNEKLEVVLVMFRLWRFFVYC